MSLVEPDMVGVVSDFLKKNGNDVDPRIERIHELTKSPKYEDWSDEYQAGFYESLCRRWKHVLDCQFLNWEDARNMWELFSIKYRVVFLKCQIQRAEMPNLWRQGYF